MMKRKSSRLIQKRRLNLQSLESRRLLAVDCVPNEPLETGDALRLANVVHVPEVPANADIADIDLGHHDDLTLPVGPHLNLHGPDLIQEIGDRVVVVDQNFFLDNNNRLVVFERSEDGTLTPEVELEVGFQVQDMIVTESQVLLFGNDFPWQLAMDAAGRPNEELPDILPHPSQTNVLTVNLDSENEDGGVEVVRQEFEGSYYALHHEDDQVVMLSSNGNDAVIAIFPPPELFALARTLEITADGLRQIASGEVPQFGITAVHDGQLYSGATKFHEIVFLMPPDAAGLNQNEAGIREPDEPYPQPVPTASVAKFAADSNDVIAEVGRLELGTGFLSSFHVADDGASAVAIVTDFGLGIPSSSVHLIDLSGEEMRIFETIQLQGFSGDALHVGDYAVLRDYSSQSLLVVDLDQSIDIAAESRVRRVQMPDNVSLHFGHIEINPNRLVILAERFEPAVEPAVEPTDPAVEPAGDLPRNRKDRERPEPIAQRQLVLLTLSIPRAAIIGDTNLPGSGYPHHLVLIDSATQRLGFVADNRFFDEESRPKFVFGHLSEVGEFVRDGAFPAGRWLEIDANADRLIARESDRIVEYDWEDLENPTITPLGEPEPTLLAVNDAYTLQANGESHLLDVLANDQIRHFNFPTRVKIVELIGAPEGAEIVDGHSVRIPAAALGGVETLRFEYVISDGNETSTAVVEATVFTIDEAEVQELINAVRAQAAEDLGVAVEDVKINSVERVFGQPLPVVLPGGEELDLSPGILVILETPNATALYAASLEGRIVQAFASIREFLVELGLRAVDDSGQTLEEVTTGQEFWLEFNATDLREFGLGVYAAFFDLAVPVELLEITGPIEYGQGFTGIAGSSFGPDFIDNGGAVSEDIDPPGNATQSILRIGVRAAGAGQASLRPKSADAPGTEALLRGRQTEVPDNRVRYAELELKIVDGPAVDPLDSNGDGDVTAGDALVVINFLARYGVVNLEDLAERVRGVRGESEELTDTEIDSMRRMDTNRSGNITALDALVVVNKVSQQRLATERAANGEEETPTDIHDLGLLF
jgi:Dockerin type I domain